MTDPAEGLEPPPPWTDAEQDWLHDDFPRVAAHIDALTAEVEKLQRERDEARKEAAMDPDDPAWTLLHKNYDAYCKMIETDHPGLLPSSYEDWVTWNTWIDAMDARVAQTTKEDWSGNAT